MCLTTNQAERDSATGYRMICEVIGVLLSVGIPSIFITILGSSSSNCENQNTLTNESLTSNITASISPIYKMVTISAYIK